MCTYVYYIKAKRDGGSREWNAETDEVEGSKDKWEH
jgi:hypothetical protein